MLITLHFVCSAFLVVGERPDVAFRGRACDCVALETALPKWASRGLLRTLKGCTGVDFLGLLCMHIFDNARFLDFFRYSTLIAAHKVVLLWLGHTGSRPYSTPFPLD